MIVNVLKLTFGVRGLNPGFGTVDPFCQSGLVIISPALTLAKVFCTALSFSVIYRSKNNNVKPLCKLHTFTVLVKNITYCW